ncbi:TauD/TfdA family dioxygenase [Nonomuraea sp. NPDC052265]|uniref:TauD/TfdA family dioxygenase n=1 Tax=Nonomuraea sp. NPDC052265 TaxID=3364374 RepID=UPI0037C718F1
MSIAPIRDFTSHPGLELSRDERKVVEALASRLTRVATGRVDDSAWLDEARSASCRLPVRLMETLRHYRHDAGRQGFLTIANLPVGAESLPATPTMADSVERRATVASATAVILAHQLGEVIAYRSEKNGALVHNIVPVPALASTQSNGGSVQLQVHTENAFHPNRPDYVGLLCLRTPDHELVSTRVCSVLDALPFLTDADRTLLHEPRFRTAPPPSFRSAARSEPHGVLSGDAEDPDLRVDLDTTTGLDRSAGAALDRLRQAIMDVSADLVLRPGDMAILDNRIVAHGRSAYSPRYDGTDRWLHRVFVHLDIRRSRSRRADNGMVLD